jgi:hypothetical protein
VKNPDITPMNHPEVNPAIKNEILFDEIKINSHKYDKDI